MRNAVSSQAMPPEHAASAFNNLLSSFNMTIFGARSIEKRGAQEAGKSKECCEPILFACDPTSDPPLPSPTRGLTAILFVGGALRRSSLDPVL